MTNPLGGKSPTAAGKTAARLRSPRKATSRSGTTPAHFSVHGAAKPPKTSGKGRKA